MRYLALGTLMAAVAAAQYENNQQHFVEPYAPVNASSAGTARYNGSLPLSWMIGEVHGVSWVTYLSAFNVTMRQIYPPDGQTPPEQLIYNQTNWPSAKETPVIPGGTQDMSIQWNVSTYDFNITNTASRQFYLYLQPLNASAPGNQSAFWTQAVCLASTSDEYVECMGYAEAPPNTNGNTQRTTAIIVGVSVSALCIILFGLWCRQWDRICKKAAAASKARPPPYASDDIPPGYWKNSRDKVIGDDLSKAVPLESVAVHVTQH